MYIFRKYLQFILYMIYKYKYVYIYIFLKYTRVCIYVLYIYYVNTNFSIVINLFDSTNIYIYNKYLYKYMKSISCK